VSSWGDWGIGLEHTASGTGNPSYDDFIDPRQLAAGMMYLHTWSHAQSPQNSWRGDKLPRDIDRLSDIFTKRQQMQRDYEKKNPGTKDLITQANRIIQAMAWEDWRDKIRNRGEKEDDMGDITGRYVIPQAGAFLDYSHRNHMGKPSLHVDGVYTHPDNRNDGVAEALMRQLAEDNPGVPINPGYMTPDGQAFHDRILQKEPTARDLITAANRILGETNGHA